MIPARSPRLRPLLAVLALAAIPALGRAQYFAPQTLAVVAIGEGSAPISASGNAVSLLNFAKTGALQRPRFSAGLPLFLGDDPREGQIAGDGASPLRLAVGGFAAPVESGSVAATAATAVRRRVAQFDAATGAAVYSDLSANDYAGGALFSAHVVGNRLVTGGLVQSGSSFDGVRSGTFNGAATGGQAAIGGLAQRDGFNVQLIGGTVYGSSQNFLRSYATTTPVIVFATSGTISDFVFTDANTLYYTDSSTTGGLFRATRTGSSFGDGVRVGGLTDLPPLGSLAFDGQRFYATTYGVSDNSLLSIDPATGASVTLARAGTNRAFRGVEVVPEPATMAILGIGALGLLRRRRRTA